MTGKNALNHFLDASNCSIDALLTPTALISKSDIEYARIGGHSLSLDVTYPGDGSLHPLVLLVHGGGFVNGDKKDMATAMRRLAEQGYSTASVNYRLARDDATRFPAQIQDLRCAVRWLRVNAARFAIDIERVAVQGDSAGATLAALLGTTANDTDLDHPDCPIPPSEAAVRVSAVIGNAGRVDVHLSEDITPPGAAPFIVSWLGVDPRLDLRPATETVVNQASPITHVTGGSAPFLLIHGRRDHLVGSHHYERFAKVLTDAKVFAYVIDEDWGHAPPIFSTDPRYRRAFCSSLNFLKWQLQKD